MRHRISTEPAAKAVNRTLGARSRERRRHLCDESAAHSPAPLDRRNDPLPSLVPESLPLAALQPPKRNARNVEPVHIAEVMDSISRFGVVRPVLIDQNRRVIDGWIIVEAGRRLGFTELPCLIAGHLTPDEGRLLRIALNRLQEKGTWDLDALRGEFEALIELEIPLEVTGFEAAEVDLVLAGNEIKLDEAANATPEVEAERAPISRKGDLWQLGHHRLLCADACDAASYEMLMSGTRASAVFTDPPYNIAIAGFAVGKGSTQHREFVQASGEMSDAEFETFLERFLLAASAHLTDGALIYACMDWRSIARLITAGDRAGLDLLNVIVWAKPSGGMGGLYRGAHELIALFKKGSAAHQDNVRLGKHGRDRTNVWHYPGAASPGSSARAQLATHPTPKPVELVADALLDVTRRGDIVLDPFMGSGTTIIAAEKTRRLGYGLELDPRYVDVIVRRWETYTGKAAVHAGTGRTFTETASDRAHETVRSRNAETSEIEMTAASQTDAVSC